MSLLKGISDIAGGIGLGIGSVGSLFANSQNLDFQKENLEYQKALQQQIFEREDTAYQRTVNDMRMAGLSPLSMSGTNSAGSAISTSAPQNGFNETLSSMVSLASTIGQLAQVQSGIARTDAETAYINEQAKNLATKNKYQDDTSAYELENARINAFKERRNLDSSNYYGYSSDMPDAIKNMLIMSSGKTFHHTFENHDSGDTRGTYDPFTTHIGNFTKDSTSLDFGALGQYLKPLMSLIQLFK